MFIAKNQYSITGISLCHSFAATPSELEKHLQEYMKYHIYLIGKYLSDWKVNGVNKSNDEAVKSLLYSELHKINEALERIKTMQVIELQSKQNDILFRLAEVEDILSVLQENITEITRTFGELSLMHLTDTSNYFI